MNAEQALKILGRLQQAAPPPTAAKIAEVAALLETLERDKTALETMTHQGIADANERARQALSAGLYEEAVEAAPEAEDASFSAAPASTDSESIVLSETEEILMQIDEALRTPLEIVRKQINTILAGELGRFRNEQYKVFETIAENNRSALHLLDNVTQMIALRHDLLEVDTLVFSCPLLAREAVDAAQPEAKARNQTLTLHQPDVALQAEGDYQRVLTILSDMLDNAIHYTPPGGTIDVSLEALGTHVLFSVADNGIGLSDEDMQHVGEPFWRAQHQELVRQQPGTGLRLCLSRALLALQGGELIFSGEEEVGSTFSFTLPAAAS